jgi:hypothetical protein
MDLAAPRNIKTNNAHEQIEDYISMLHRSNHFKLSGSLVSKSEQF